jgi:hypothetical protein
MHSLNGTTAAETQTGHLESLTMDKERWKKIHVIENIFEMDIIKDAFEKEGLEYSIKEYKDTAYDGLFVLQKGYAGLYVRENDEDLARSIVTRIRSLPHVAYSKD